MEDIRSMATGAIFNDSDTSSMWETRAKAIQSYANLEQALCRLFAMLAGTQLNVAGIIFFKITSSQARLDIIEKLWKLRFYHDYNLFRNSLIKGLKPIDTKRNEIVHWNMVGRQKLDINGGLSETDLTLRPPTFWTHHPGNIELNESDLYEFYKKCRFYTRIISIFDGIIRNSVTNMTSGEIDSWREIFQQELIYPPPEGTPLRTILEELQTPHQSSDE
jgi:hypothetical protein